ncbi:MAG: hypothetical protein JNL57_03415 [Bacteroidetes bacterium]|nr:hypothetical protein [Bacteroidota bacterium]
MASGLLHAQPADSLLRSSARFAWLKQHAGDSITGPFARVYVQTFRELDRELADKDSGFRNFCLRLTDPFADLYIAAADSHAQYGLVPAHWQPYFAHCGNRFQRQLRMGLRAHIRGDLSPVLIHTFHSKELRQYKREFLRLRPAFRRVVAWQIRELGHRQTSVRWQHRLTLGFDKRVAVMQIQCWRRKALRKALRS